MVPLVNEDESTIIIYSYRNHSQHSTTSRHESHRIRRGRELNSNFLAACSISSANEKASRLWTHSAFVPLPWRCFCIFSWFPQPIVGVIAGCYLATPVSSLWHYSESEEHLRYHFAILFKYMQRRESFL